MPNPSRRPVSTRLHHAILLIVPCSLWVAFVAGAYLWGGGTQATIIAALSGLILLNAQIVQIVIERKRWRSSIRRLASELTSIADDPARPLKVTPAPDLIELVRAVRALRRAWTHSDPPSSLSLPMNTGEFNSLNFNDSLTRSALLASITNSSENLDVTRSGDFSTTEMVCRLDSRTFHWLESSPAEQEFLGWNIEELRQMSFLEIVHPDDYVRVRDELRSSLTKGETHGLVLRIRTARAKKAIELNVGVRYGPDLNISHLRCHITDVTEKLRAERELLLRTRELTRLNEQLREINRELEDLKDRYSDLYHNAPAMYFSLDEQGRVLDCNDTLLLSLGFPRERLIGQSYERLLPRWRRAFFVGRFAEFLKKGKIELESQWINAQGEMIDVWISGTCVCGSGGKLLHSRIVAQDITARHMLEAELREKNERLASTIDELSRKNKEMDEFAYVVSHDLQEPIRTLIAFSDFLTRDCGDQLDATGQEYVSYLVDASRRMRSLIQELLALSRAGRVTGEFTSVNVEELVSRVKADLGELIRTKGAEVRLVGPDTLPTIWGDRDRIGQLLANLIGNGLKYNQSPTPYVEVGARELQPDGWVTLFVRDNGIGVDPQFHTKIFQLFRRLHTREEYEGTGAGLAICTKIVHAHGGQIWIESQANQGATFFIKLRRPSSELNTKPTELTHAN